MLFIAGVSGGMYIQVHESPIGPRQQTAGHTPGCAINCSRVNPNRDADGCKGVGSDTAEAPRPGHTW